MSGPSEVPPERDDEPRVSVQVAARRKRRDELALAIGLLVLLIAVVVTALIASSRPGDHEGAPASGPVGEPIGQIQAPIVIQQGQWQCSGPQSHTVVIVQDPVNTKKDPPEPYSAAVSLGAGCTGTIGAIIVEGNQRDGIKVGGSDKPGGPAHDLEILSAWIYCGPRIGNVHQDGVQAGGGRHVHFHNLHVDCPQSNNSAFFTNSDDPANPPTDVTCTACDLLAANAAANLGGDNSVDNGVRNSILRKGTSPNAPATCVRNAENATNPVNEANVCIDPNPTIDTGEPISP